MLAHYWIRYLGKIANWSLKGFKGKISEIDRNNDYTYYLGIAVTILIFVLIGKIF